MSYPISPKVTVLMSVLNGEQYVQSAINSILLQTFTDFEFLIIDDGSTDKTHECIESYKDPRIKLIHNKLSLGLTKSLNIGLRFARGEYIARLDHDDISLFRRLEYQVKYLDEHPEVAVVGGQYIVINSIGKVLPFQQVKKAIGMDGILLHMAIDNPFIHSAVLFRKDAVLRIGGYNEDFMTSQDIELWTRLLSVHNGANLESNVLKFRVHLDSVSSGRYAIVKKNDREQIIRRGSQLMLMNIRRIISESELPDEWVKLYVGIYTKYYPETKSQAKLLCVGMKKMSDYVFSISPKDRPYAMQLLSSKYFLMSKHLLKGGYVLEGIYSLILSFSSDWKCLIKAFIGSIINLFIIKRDNRFFFKKRIEIGDK